MPFSDTDPFAWVFVEVSDWSHEELHLFELFGLEPFAQFFVRPACTFAF